ncbi:uncharacterized protein LOC133532827, partial [Cydia pomonella]|uniref:uncharacterized protein LOC133532827 n=1 Tax=Cydia pomonella TaxID=82600 RepID=UPI002ADE45BA
ILRYFLRQLTIEINVKDPQPQDFGDYFGLIENSRGQEERHKLLTVRENDYTCIMLDYYNSYFTNNCTEIQLNRFEVSCDVQGNYNNITKYECADCQLTDILCNGQSVLAAGRVTIIPQSQQISYNFPSFADQFSCVYMGFFKVKDTVYKKVVAVIESKYFIFLYFS